MHEEKPVKMGLPCNIQSLCYVQIGEAHHVGWKWLLCIQASLRLRTHYSKRFNDRRSVAIIPKSETLRMVDNSLR